MTDTEHQASLWLAHAASGALRAAARLNLAGLVLALVNVLLAGIIISVANKWLMVDLVLALASAAQLWLLVRIEIDRKLFQILSRACTADDLAALDAALVALGWMPKERVGRNILDRARGAIRFLTLAGAMMALQWLIAMATLLLR